MGWRGRISVVSIAALLLVGCAQNSDLAIIQSDPLATTSFDGAIEVERTETAGGDTLGGKPAVATVRRSFAPEDGEGVDALFEAIQTEAELAGWELEVGTIDGQLIGTKAANDGTIELRIIRQRTDVVIRLEFR